jgi:type III pantothenate kinase
LPAQHRKDFRSQEGVGPITNAADAIETGCLLAQAGVIERAFATMEDGAACVLSGGAARRIARHLGIPVRLVDNLVLEGLVRIAEDATK